MIDVASSRSPRKGLAALRARDIDLAAVVQFPELDLDDLKWIALRTEPAVLVVRADDPLAGHQALNLADLSDLPFVVTRHGNGLRRLFDQVFVDAERPPRIEIPERR